MRNRGIIRRSRRRMEIRECTILFAEIGETARVGLTVRLCLRVSLIALSERARHAVHLMGLWRISSRRFRSSCRVSVLDVGRELLRFRAAPTSVIGRRLINARQQRRMLSLQDLKRFISISTSSSPSVFTIFSSHLQTEKVSDLF